MPQKVQSNLNDKLFRWFTWAAITYCFLDTATTIIGMKLGIAEANPIYTGVLSLLFTKLLILIIFYFLYLLTVFNKKEPQGILFFRIVTIISLVVVTWNIFMIIRVMTG